jgi:hypothetical protein
MNNNRANTESITEVKNNIGGKLMKDSFSKELSDLGLDYSEAVRMSKCKKRLELNCTRIVGH